jgi:hypothetical protein
MAASLAVVPSQSLAFLAAKMEVLVARLALDDGTDAGLCMAGASLLRSVLRDLRAFVMDTALAAQGADLWAPVLAQANFMKGTAQAHAPGTTWRIIKSDGISGAEATSTNTLQRSRTRWPPGAIPTSAQRPRRRGWAKPKPTAMAVTASLRLCRCCTWPCFWLSQVSGGCIILGCGRPKRLNHFMSVA